MSRMKYICENITILNTVLLSAAILMSNYFLLPFLKNDITFSLPSGKKVAVNDAADHSEFNPPSPADYLMIADENLFHPERRIPPEKKVEPELPKPDFILYGTMISDELKVAYLEDLKVPRTTPGRGKRQIAVKKGDTFSGFILREVDPDKIVMVRGEEKMMVNVIDKRKTKMRETSEPPDKKGTAQPSQQRRTAPTESQPAVSPPKDKIMPVPPRNNLESAVFDYFKIDNK